MKLEIHPLAELIPAMSAEEFAQLKTGIDVNGYLEDEPVVLFEGRILDGRHRYRACGELGIEAPTVDFRGGEDAAQAYVISKNLDRRHLTTGQRSVAALKLLDWEREAARERQAATQLAGREPGGDPIVGSRQVMGTDGAEEQEKPTPHSSEAVAKAGEKFGVSGSSVERAKKVAEERPDLLKKVEAGELTVNSAFNETKGKPPPEPKALDLSKERNRQRAEKQQERLWKLLTNLDGARIGLEDFDLDPALAVTSEEDAKEMNRMLTECLTAFRELRSNIKTTKGL